MSLNIYLIHAHVEKFDRGLKANTESNPNITVEAESKKEAINKARQKIRTEQESSNQCVVKSIDIEVVKKVGGNNGDKE